MRLRAGIRPDVPGRVTWTSPCAGGPAEDCEPLLATAPRDPGAHIWRTARPVPRNLWVRLLLAFAGGLPRPAAGQLDLEAEAEEGPDQDDPAEDQHAFERRRDRDRADDVRRDEQLQAKQDRPAELLPEGRVNVRLAAGQPAEGDDRHEGDAAGDDRDPGRVDDPPDRLDPLPERLGHADILRVGRSIREVERALQRPTTKPSTSTRGLVVGEARTLITTVRAAEVVHCFDQTKRLVWRLAAYRSTVAWRTPPTKTWALPRTGE